MELFKWQKQVTFLELEKSGLSREAFDEVLAIEASNAVSDACHNLREGPEHQLYQLCTEAVLQDRSHVGLKRLCVM